MGLGASGGGGEICGAECLGGDVWGGVAMGLEGLGGELWGWRSEGGGGVMGLGSGGVHGSADSRALQDWEQRQEEDTLLIERILLLVRNVLHVPPDPAEEQVLGGGKMGVQTQGSPQ